MVDEAATEPRAIDLIVQLDEALHGSTWARPYSPQRVWESLLDEVRMLSRFEGAVIKTVRAFPGR